MPEQSTEHYIVRDDGSVSFTPAGHDYYRPYFEQMGISIDSITTADRLRRAKKIIRPLLLEKMENELASQPPSLERAWLLSVLEGDLKEFIRLSNLLERKGAAGLKIVR